MFNPVSQLFYSLRHHKDKFSTLNQGTGAYCFDIWIGYVLKEYPKLTAQFHDEGVWSIKKGSEEWFTKILRNSIDKANEFLNLNRQLDIGINFGENYGQIH